MRFLPIEWLLQHPTLFFMAVGFTLVGMWLTFEKARQPGWAALIPIYNVIVLARVAGAPMWTVLLYFVPVLNVFAALAHSLRIARHFGKSALFGFGLFFLGFIFWPVLGMGKAKYRLVAWT
ncbi:MAG: DUF5684 domain-containing protein [Myxococcota bacterium]